MDGNELQNGLAQFYGTEHYYGTWMKQVVYTDGIKFLAMNAGGGAMWLIDLIESYQPGIKSGKIKSPRKDMDLNDFQVWRLKKTGPTSAVVECFADDGLKASVRQEIEYTDFPLDEISLYVERGEHMTLMLPSER